MIRPDPSQADSALMLNQVLAVPAKKLAVFWLLSNNSQTPQKPLNSRRKFAPKVGNNSQKKFLSKTARNSQLFAALRRQAIVCQKEVLVHAKARRRKEKKTLRAGRWLRSAILPAKLTSRESPLRLRAFA
ncbi:MAG: hypothetical protein ABIS51_07660 [Sphingomonas sp.]